MPFITKHLDQCKTTNPTLVCIYIGIYICVCVWFSDASEM